MKKLRLIPSIFHVKARKGLTGGLDDDEEHVLVSDVASTELVELSEQISLTDCWRMLEHQSCYRL